MLNFFLERYSKHLLRTCHYRTYTTTTTGLQDFIKRYFNPYTFIIPKDAPILNDFSLVLFRVKKTYQTDRSSHYSVIPHFDPAISLLQNITLKSSLDINFRISPCEKDFYMFSSSSYLPTHFSLRIRDEFENQGIKTFTTMSDAIQQTITLDKDPFEPKFNTKKDFHQTLKCWNQIPKVEQQNIIGKFRHEYYDIFFNPSNRGSTWNGPTFEVHNESWDLADAHNRSFYDNKIHATNTVIKLIEFSKTRHSSVSGYKGSATTGGALWINSDCPGIDFLYKYYNDIPKGHGYDNVMRHTVCRSGLTNEYDRLYGFNGYIPYWMKIYLYESFLACGIDVKNLM